MNKKKQSKKEDIVTNSAKQSNKKNENKPDKNTLPNKSDRVPIRGIKHWRAVTYRKNLQQM